VICSESDFRWSLEVIRRHGLEGKLAVLVSPAFGLVDPRELARWMLESGVDARLNLQIHKLIWGPDVKGV
jgi:7-carboxy-7-deazaguanine synthase